ncbi:ATP-grasp domain-containing protein [Amycolatopsis endophytica]|uniref:Biotin carboxylase n=1 Tax=Amycolatopsis endophytica TaxID=860233 RepID=A0A853B694_9PSEU|nr:ATP-grasp domain-containing protein [Amycolatopsis endophytica]NYI90763.1 biotin carboxylase [Amycolatopsis endophytica]
MHVLILMPASAGQLYPEAGRRMGIRTTVITNNQGFYRLGDHIREFIDEVCPVGTLSPAEIREAAREIHRREPVHAVVAGVEFTVPIAAEVAAELGIPGIDPADALVVREKSEMRARLHEAGVRAPAFVVASSSREAADAGEVVGFPCVIKPVGMLGTIGVRRADGRDDLVAGYADIIGETVPMGDRLPGATVVVEQYLRGKEFSAEGYVERGRATVLAITEKWLGREPHFQQQGHIVRPAAQVPGHEDVTAYLDQVTRALGLTTGPFHAEYRLTAEGPTLVEIAGRMGGDQIAAMVETVTGLSLAQAAIATAAGVEVPAPGTPTASAAGIHYVIDPARFGATYRALEGWDEALALPGVRRGGIDIPAGQPIPDRPDMRSRIAHVMFEAGSYDEAVALRRKLEETIRVVG